MTDVTLLLPPEFGTTDIQRVVELVCSDAGLEVASRGTLKKYPGSVHWHFRRAGERGTLEATYWPERSKLWITVREGREAHWTFGALEEVPRLWRLRFGPGSNDAD